MGGRDGVEEAGGTDRSRRAPIVVGSDAAAQSDIYSAVTLAGVVGTDCVVLAGPRDGPMAASQQARLDAAASGGFVVGGFAAVPAAKLAGREMTRLAGADRWSTAQQVGSRARMLGGGGDSTPDAPALDYSLRVPDDVRQPGVHLHGAAPWIASDCAGDAAIVVGSDADAQSDIYSAVTLAGVVGTVCVVLAGPRDGPMAASQQARLDAAASGGFVVGGIAAVPTAKLAGRDMTRLAGTDRWETARLVGRRAGGDTTAGTSTADEEPAPEESETEESTTPERNTIQPYTQQNHELPFDLIKDLIDWWYAPSHQTVTFDGVSVEIVCNARDDMTFSREHICVHPETNINDLELFQYRGVLVDDYYNSTEDDRDAIIQESKRVYFNQDLVVVRDWCHYRREHLSTTKFCERELAKAERR